MSPLVLALVLAAAAPSPAQKAKELAGRKAWDELYLAFSAGDANTVPKEQRAAVSGALTRGCEALLSEDAVMAAALGERATVFDESAPALHCSAYAARRTEQRAAAEAALRKGLERFPKDGAFPLELGKLLLEEQDSAGAVAALERVPPRAKEAAEARKLLQQARQSAQEESAARTEASRIERQLAGATRLPAQAPPPISGPQPSPGDDEDSVASLTGGGRGSARMVKAPTVGSESRVDATGRRVRANRRFVIKYYNNDRDFQQRADYEGKVVEILDEAYFFTRGQLGLARETPVLVVLYSKAEFAQAFGEYLAQVVAGRYASSAIRINDAIKLTKETKATLVHEYIHATVADMCGGEDMDMATLPLWVNEGIAKYLEWVYLGRDGPDPALKQEMLGLGAQNALFPLRFMVDMAPARTSAPDIAYAVSAVAVREMIRREGIHRLLTFMKEICLGNHEHKMESRKSIDQALRTHYGMTMEELDDAVVSSLKSR